jgi:hypothetical protein
MLLLIVQQVQLINHQSMRTIPALETTGTAINYIDLLAASYLQLLSPAFNGELHQVQNIYM